VLESSASGRGIDHAKAELAIFEQIESPDAEKARRKLADWQGSDHRIKPENMRKKVGPVEGMRRLPIILDDRLNPLLIIFLNNRARIRLPSAS